MMNEVVAIHRSPDESDILKVFREPHIGEWISGSQLCREVLCDGLMGSMELVRVEQAMIKIDLLTSKGFLESSKLNEKLGYRIDWLELNGYRLNPADPVLMSKLMWHPIGRGLTKAYKITARGRAQIGCERYVRPIVASTVMTALTACSTFDSTLKKIPEQISAKAEVKAPIERHDSFGARQIFQDRDSQGRPIWSYCENDCPSPTPKVQYKAPVAIQTPVIVRQVVEQQKPEIHHEETLKFTVYFKLNSATIDQIDRSKVNELLNGKYRWKSIHVTGRADPLGASGHNQKLAEKRAGAMVQVLALAGVPTSSVSQDIRVEMSAGESGFHKLGIDPRTPGQKSRRVDVVVVRIKQ